MVQHGGMLGVQSLILLYSPEIDTAIDPRINTGRYAEIDPAIHLGIDPAINQGKTQG